MKPYRFRASSSSDSEGSSSPFSSPSDPFLPTSLPPRHQLKWPFASTGRISSRRVLATTFVTAFLYVAFHSPNLRELASASIQSPEVSPSTGPELDVAAACTPADEPSLLLSDGDFFSFSNHTITPNRVVAILPSPHPVPSKARPPLPEPPEWTEAEVPLSCLDDYISLGKPCGPPTSEQLDVVWQYVNGSDPLLQRTFLSDRELVWRATSPESARYPKIKAGTFREFDELRHSMRSMLQHFRRHARKFWLVGTDFKLPGCGDWRVGQMPQWLAPTGRNWSDGGTELQMFHHSNIFPPMHDLTTYNSYAIETRLHHLPGLAKYFVHMNDDFFANKNLSNFDFYSKSFGPIFRMDVDLLVSWEQPITGWPASTHSNHLLGARFGKRGRPYLSHMAKTLGSHFIQELETIWPDEVASTASHIVRNDFGRTNDVYPAFLMTHYVVERWREALLWSWVVAKMGDDDDGWDDWKAWKALGGRLGKSSIMVTRKGRDTVKKLNETMAENGITSNTELVYSSLDGYPYSGLETKRMRKLPGFRTQSPPATVHPGTQCTIILERCFYTSGDGLPKASEVFKHVAFREVQCGDCIIDALMNQSGRLGMQAFLPGSARRAPPAHESTKQPHETSKTVPRLPLTNDWATTDFTLHGVLGDRPDLTVREWVEQALVRYRFMIGHTELKFVMIQTTANTKSLQMIGNEPAMICVNDDLWQDQNSTSVRTDLKAWMGKKWPRPAQWEVDMEVPPPIVANVTGLSTGI